MEDLPAPFGPIIAKTSPFLTSNDTSVNALTPPKARLIICQDNWSQYEGDLSANQVHKPVPNIFQSRDINNTKKPHNVEMVKAQNSQQNGSEGGRWGGRGGGRGQFIISIHMKCKKHVLGPLWDSGASRSEI